MVFAVISLKNGPKVTKNWYGCSIRDTYSLIELFHDFCGGKIDHQAPIDDNNDAGFSARVTVTVGKSRDGTFVSCDPECKVGDIVYILFSQSSDGSEKTNNDPVHDAFSILMSAASKASHLPEKHSNPVNDKIKLQNDIIDWLQEQNVGFLSTNVDTLGKSFVHTLADCLWYIDENHHTLEGRGCHIPAPLAHLKGYRRPSSKKNRKLDSSFLEEGILRSHSTAILLLSNNAYLQRDQWKGVQKIINDFGTSLKKYSDYLSGQKLKTSTNAARVVTGEKQSWDVLSPKPIMPGPKARYQSLHTALIHSSEYVPVLVNDYAPGEPNRRFDYIKGLVVPIKCVKYTYTGAKEHLTFLWKVPVDSSEKDILDKNAKISSNLLKTLPKFHTRAMRREFLSLFGRSIHNKAAFLREAYRRLTGDCSASLTASESEVDKRVSDILDNEDSDLIWDLRVNNQGRPEKYLEFLEECQKYISQKIETAVDDRRHDEVDSEGDVITHLADAFSIRDLHEQVVKQCPPGIRIPSKEWLRYQFWPRNCHFKSAERYTGKLKIKFMVQSRQFRKTHIDSHYASALFRYEKEFAIKYRENTSLICMDDKHKIKVGEPGSPVAMVERGKSVLVAMGKKFEVTDHDFTKFSLTPSVNLLVNIPESIDDTFYRGQVYVGIKENCFESSTPWRHATELLSVLQSEGIDKPILALYCDGGPDHRLTYATVQMSLICLLLFKDLDMLVCVRTPPYNSWKNPAERIMSVLNLGFQSVGLKRQPTASYEPKLQGLSTMTEIRNLAQKDNGLRIEVKDSIEPVKILLNNVIHRLKWKDLSLKSFSAASDDDIKQFGVNILNIDPKLVDGSTTQHQLKNKKDFNDFLFAHCCIRHYMFCIKKCGKSSCKHCKPPRMPADSFDTLHFIPDPEPENAEKYKAFDDLYGKKDQRKV